MTDGKTLLRAIEAIHLSKGLSEDFIFNTIESALSAAARKDLGPFEHISFKVDRETGTISSSGILPEKLSRKAVQVARQIIFTRL